MSLLRCVPYVPGSSNQMMSSSSSTLGIWTRTPKMPSRLSRTNSAVLMKNCMRIIFISQ